MGPLDLVLAPLRTARLAARALEDLHALAERARQEPHPVEQLRDRLDALIAVTTLIEAGGRDLTATAKDLNALVLELIGGGRDLTDTAKALKGDTARLDPDVRAVDLRLQRLLERLEVVEALEGAVETVADTVEPLQGAAERVGRVTQRFSRS